MGVRPDPYKGSYTFTNPQSLNRYSYVANDPVNFVDPSGLNLAYDGGGYDCTSVMYYGHIEVNGDPTNQGWAIIFTHCSYSPGSGSGIGGDGQAPKIPEYDEKRRKCDEKLASIFGGPGAVAAGNEFEPNGNYRGTLNGIPGHLTDRMHIYGSVDGTQDTTVFVPANYDQVTVLGPGSIAFHYQQLGDRQNVLLVVFHVADYALGPIEGGRRSIGRTGGPGNEDSTNYRHAHFELFSGRRYPTTEAERAGKRIPFSDVFCP